MICSFLLSENHISWDFGQSVNLTRKRVFCFSRIFVNSEFQEFIYIYIYIYVYFQIYDIFIRPHSDTCYTVHVHGCRSSLRVKLAYLLSIYKMSCIYLEICRTIIKLKPCLRSGEIFFCLHQLLQMESILDFCKWNPLWNGIHTLQHV